MKRILEPELMDDPAQAVAYANADFDEPHSMFIEKFCEYFPNMDISGHVLDIGCGAADISIRFSRKFSGCIIDGLDGAAAMLSEGKNTIKRAGLNHRINLISGVLSSVVLPNIPYDVIISNSLLHHLHDPDELWNTIKQSGKEGTLIYIMDLMRPASEQIARELVEKYSAEEPEILKCDFFNSLCAAFTPDEIQSQLQENGLGHLEIQILSDRHLRISGILYAQ